MKMIKKLFGSVVTLAMAFALTTSVSAATITVDSEIGKTDLSGRTFTAYQIFKGTKSGDPGQEILADVTWGDAITSAQAATTLISSLKNNFTDVAAVESLKNTSEAKEVAKALDGFTDDQGIKLAKVIYDVLAGNAEDKKIPDNVDKTVLEPKNGEYSATVQDGYYLIVDETTTGSVNPAVLQVVGDITIKPKTEDVDVVKTVKDGSDGLNNEGYGSNADYSIGDTVPFRLAAKVPDMTHYDIYKFEFVDTLSSGLDLNEDSIKVYVATDAEGTDKQEIETTGDNPLATIKTKGFTSENAPSFTVTLPNLKAIKYGNETSEITGKYIVVEYTAKMNSNAAFREENKVKLVYSNNPNTGGDGETQEKKVYVFDFTLDGLKKDGAGQQIVLSGAGFIVSRTVTTGEGETQTIKKQYATVNPKTKKITGWENWTGETSDLPENLKNGNITSENGKFTVIGLDAGKYELYEVKAPTGYNTPEKPFELEIIADHSNSDKVNLSYKLGNPTITNETTEAPGTVSMPVGNNNGSGVVAPTILNNKGTTLPETGGMGTTMIYIVGGILLLGSAILLITKKRIDQAK